MKTAIVLLGIGLFVGLIAPYLWGDRFSSAGARLPKFMWSKSPPRVVHFTANGFFRGVGLFFVLLAALCFIIFRRR